MVPLSRPRRHAGVLLLWLAPAILAGQDVVYEVQSGGTILDDCDNCDRLVVARSIAGTFTVTPAHGVDTLTYALTDIDLNTQGSTPEYTVAGKGTYTAVFPKTQSMALTVEINGVPGIQLESRALLLVAPVPFLDVTVTEPEPHRDPLHVYTLRLRAAPRAKMVPYSLVTKDISASIFIDDCPPCGRVTIPVPITGIFLLGEVSANPLFTYYRVDAVEFADTRGAGLVISGSGWYKQGGEVALVQEMSLELLVHETGYEQPGSILSTGGNAPVGAAFPDLDVQLEQENPASIGHVFSVRIVATPSATPPVQFRRGDANDDGSVDISDAVAILLWKFAGGQEPHCIDTADTDGSGGTDITDAIHLLNYLFLGDVAPPPPGPDDCGPPVEAGIGCDAYNCM